MIREHLPILQIVVPLLAAPLCVLIRHTRTVYAVALTVTWATFAMAVWLFRTVWVAGVQSYMLGGWAAPWGIEYRIDPLGAFVLLFVSGMGAVVLTYAPRSVAREIAPDRQYLFYAIYLLGMTGLLGIAITGDLFNAFVFLEISALSAYTMISLGPDRRALTAALRYLIMGAIGATFFLIGVGLLYMMTGTLNMMDMAQRLPEVGGTRTLLVAFAFLTVGLGLKMALFPLHLWLPNAYTYAPSVVSAFLAATATKVAIYLLIRLLFTIFARDFAFEAARLHILLMPLALAGILVASTVAIFQSDLKRLLAYSSVAQIGYMALGISFASNTGLTAAILHLFNHALMKGGLFLATGCLMLQVGSTELAGLRGIGKRMPWTMAAWALGGLGLIGVPVTAGFISKWVLIRAALEAGLWPVAAIVLFSSLLALVYVWRVVELAYFQEPEADAPVPGEAPLSMLIPTWALIGATLVFGVWTSVSLGGAARAAASLLGGLP